MKILGPKFRQNILFCRPCFIVAVKAVVCSLCQIDSKVIL